MVVASLLSLLSSLTSVNGVCQTNNHEIITINDMYLDGLSADLSEFETSYEYWDETTTFSYGKTLSGTRVAKISKSIPNVAGWTGTDPCVSITLPDFTDSNGNNYGSTTWWALTSNDGKELLIDDISGASPNYLVRKGLFDNINDIRFDISDFGYSLIISGELFDCNAWYGFTTRCDGLVSPAQDNCSVCKNEATDVNPCDICKPNFSLTWTNGQNICL